MERTENDLNLPVVALRLRQARMRAGISQKQLGILAGMDEFVASARMNQYERGKHIPEVSIVEKFACILHVPTAFFYTRDDTTAEMLTLFETLTKRQKLALIARLKVKSQKE
jgi:transcriptional regulator with XRE-family HTH domain